MKVKDNLIKSHRWKKRCQYFRSMFQVGKWTEGEKEIIEIEHFSYPVYRAFLSYLYTGRVDLSPEDAIGLLDLANAYCELELKDKCADLIRQGITVSNAAILFAAGVKYGAQDLEDFCFRFCLSHMSQVVQSESFQKLDDATAKQFIVQAARQGAFKN